MSKPPNGKRPTDKAGRVFKSHQLQNGSYQKRTGQSKFLKSVSTAQVIYVRTRLPTAADYFSQHLPSLEKHNADGLALALCPFHADSAPSLRVNMLTGEYKCKACGAHGVDVLAFHMAANGLDFVSAAKALGAWDAAPGWRVYR